ncbi:MAG: pyridoxamine 5'-phosphate oxidase [Betaproteobacteria bacterium]|nr:pyridoxamine 5'-phosphate oxidase [Betaproteobacteria bacterium]
MSSGNQYPSDIAFTATVKAIQERKGSRKNYANMERLGSWRTVITDDLKAFIESQDSIFIATANAVGQPYIQHRGGPKGFLKVVDQKTIAFVDYAGNRQYITQGNLSENSKAHLFLIDYENQRRVKVWGTARVVEGDEAEIKKYMPPNYSALPEQVVYFTVEAWDPNCPQHIPVKLDATF